MDVILLMAMTLDGKIARNSMEKIDWTGKKDKHYFVEVTKDAGVIIMGSKTFDTIGKVLPGRINVVMTTDKTRVSREKNLVFTDQTPVEIIDDLTSQGFEKVALIGGSIINSLFARCHLITRIHVTIVPRLFGTGLSLFSESMDSDLELEDVVKIDKGHLLLKYVVSH